MTNLAIAANGLRKSYRDKTGDKVVLDGVDLAVLQGTIFFLPGPDGAGKTTTVQILSTLIRADGGQVQVAGYDLNRQADDMRYRYDRPRSQPPGRAPRHGRRRAPA